jgi:hypothetical protein
MSRSAEDIMTDILGRNELREQADLPLLDVDLETQRLKKADDEAEFEEYFKSNKRRFEHLWCERGLGFLSRMGRWSHARTKLHGEWLAGRHIFD